MSDTIAFEIKRHIGVVAEYETGWRKEVNVVSWNNGVPKIDVREWSPDHSRMTKGITLHQEEAKNLGKILCTL